MKRLFKFFGRHWILWNLLVVTVSLFGVEIAGRLLGRTHNQTNVRKVKHEKVFKRPSASDEFSDALRAAVGGGVNPDSTIRHVVKQRGTTLFKAHYTIDELGRRETKPSGATHRFLAVYGCSFVFGEGLSDAETLPSQISKRVPGLQVYNYGMRGKGPNSALGRLQKFPLSSEVPFQKGTAVFIALDLQVERVVGSSMFLAWASGNTPHFELTSSGELVNRGPWSESVPNRYKFYRQFAARANSSYFFNGVALPLFYMDRSSTWDLMAAIFVEMKKQLAQQMPEVDFAVVLYPKRSEKIEKYLVPRLKQQGVRTVFISNAFDGVDPGKLAIPADGHPTRLANELIAEALIKEMKL